MINASIPPHRNRTVHSNLLNHQEKHSPIPSLLPLEFHSQFCARCHAKTSQRLIVELCQNPVCSILMYTYCSTKKPGGNNPVLNFLSAISIYLRKVSIFSNFDRKQGTQKSNCRFMRVFGRKPKVKNIG